MKDKKAKADFHGFIEIVNEFEREPNKVLVDKGKEVYKNFMQKWLDNDDILICLTQNEGKLVTVS